MTSTDENPIKQATTRLELARIALLRALGPSRRPLVIGIDGQNGAGKTHTAHWLAWQLGMPTVHLDLYRAYENGGSFSGWRSKDLQILLDEWVGRLRRPVIVEGVNLLDAMESIGRDVDFLIYVRRPLTTACNKLSSSSEYLRRRKRLRHPNFSLLGYIPDHNA